MGGTSRVALGVILGAMMAIDMGGPCNKAAYVFGTAAITNGNYDIMAAVMIGGMVPPLAIALATTFFPAKFTPEERKNGPVNYIMGLSFITEGAIPLRGQRPGPGHPGLCPRRGAGRRAFNALPVHAHGTPRRDLRLCRRRPLAAVSALLRQAPWSGCCCWRPSNGRHPRR